MRFRASRRQQLQGPFSSFPNGWPGIGLIFLRLTIALNATTFGVEAFARSDGNAFVVWLVGFLSIIVGAALLLGILTLFASALTTIGYLFLGLSSFLTAKASHCVSFLTPFDLAGVSLALLLLGPGASSLDARFFGRREIIIPAGRSRSGSAS